MPPTTAAIEQCKRDIAKLQDELKRLEVENCPKPRNGDIVRSGWGVRIIIASDGDSNVAAAYGPSGESMCSTPGVVAGLYADGDYTVIGNVFDLAKGL